MKKFEYYVQKIIKIEKLAPKKGGAPLVVPIYDNLLIKWQRWLYKKKKEKSLQWYLTVSPRAGGVS